MITAQTFILDSQSYNYADIQFVVAKAKYDYYVNISLGQNSTTK